MRLICEGQCNGGAVQEFDAAVSAAGRSGSSSLISEAWLKVCRAFRYTVHVASKDHRDHFRCVECGTERRYGRTGHGWS